MPQMAPISWLFLFSLFSLTLILFCITNYFINIPNTPKSTQKNILLNSLNWKW
uniref:ATP synthase complex subunit 8 n=1 Tax=Rhaphidophora quadrispina TaxID=2982643 RepID=A0A977XKM7_9ORTH|nr:ATP synthase F0 subunit 8 [Rhaphidophora quadrispina]UXP34377.1 ATP synthase F0 subunit 8 [Rhaphidophora quadrispina]